MTTALPPGTPGFVKLSFADRDTDDGLALPVSHGTANTWIAIPWDTDDYDPALPSPRQNGMHDPGGWTVLYGPAIFIVTGFIRVKHQVDEGASMHLMPRVAKRVNGVNVIQRSLEATERFVGPNEVHVAAGETTYSNTHLDNAQVEMIGADERLQIFADYWNATEPASIVGGTVTIAYWPLG